VISNQDHRFLIAEQLRAAGVRGARIILEPAGRNTAPAAAIAALQVVAENPDGMMLIMPSDHAVLDVAAFHESVSIARKAAQQGALVTFGIKPAGPETGYGYIKGAAPLTGAPGVFAVERFVEKPDRDTHNPISMPAAITGIAVCSCSRPKAFWRRWSDCSHACWPVAAMRWRMAIMTWISFVWASRPFLACPSDSIDYAVMEKAAHAAVVPVDMGWSDVGSWHSLWDIAERGADGNALQGDVVTQNVRNSYIRSEGPLVAALGVENLVVVATKDALLVSHRDACQDVKKIVEQLESGNRDQHIHHAVVHRPWGTYESIDSGATLPGQADRGQSRRQAVASDAPSPGGALDRGAGHGAGDL
jgi:mannose-1-phosphate guanylyltransferase/mannose-6-phosphate isomerase